MVKKDYIALLLIHPPPLNNPTVPSSETSRNYIKDTEEHCVPFSDLYSLHVHIYDYFKLGLLTNPKLVM